MTDNARPSAEYHGWTINRADDRTLRDWFAGQAMLGWLASYGQDSLHPAACETQDENTGCPFIADLSYKLADAMIARRNKE